MLFLWTQAALASVALAQQVYIPADGPTPRPQCKATPAEVKPQYTYKPFSNTMTETVRYATSVPPATTTSTYAVPLASLTGLATSLSYTTWGKWNPNATETAEDASEKYGSAAWTALWEHANPPNFTETSVYSTTVSPTPVPSSELVLPPSDYFGPQDCYSFPEHFEFGVSGSAGQIEGATADEGKSPSLLDISVLDDRPKSYVTNENYFYYKQDIERLAAMGIKRYAFSIAWTRILPFALPGTPVNQKGIEHYDDLINFVLEKGMVPVVTLFHFDTPLQFYGENLTTAMEKPRIGYLNGGYQNETFTDAFVNYARIVMSHYADRVPVWFTFNEPLLHSYNGKSIDNVIKAHAQVYHFYKEVLKGTGKISLRLNNNFGVPKDPQSKADVDAAEHFNSFQLGPFANPIFLGKDYPESYKSIIQDHVPLTEEDLEFLNGTADFFAMNHYTATVVSAPQGGIAACVADDKNALRPYCVTQSNINAFGWNIGYRSLTYVYTTPTYLRSYLSYVWNTWRHPVVITEFGFPVFGESEKALEDQLFDTPRSNYYLSYLSEVLKAIWEDGVDVAGAYTWTFADNWEFGGNAQFGVQHVNRTDQVRRYKKSFFDVVDFVKARGA